MFFNPGHNKPKNHIASIFFCFGIQIHSVDVMAVKEIKNMVLNVPATANSEWSEDYLPKFACASYRQRHVSSRRFPQKTWAKLGRDLTASQFLM